MRVLILGATGMLGHKLYQWLLPDFETFGTVRGDFERLERFGIFEPASIVCNVTTEPDSVRRAIENIQPDVIVNAIGVVKQVSDDIVELLDINAIFPHQLEKIADGYNIRVITISTDCVFAGERGNYTEDDVADARDVYGLSKYLGELNGPNSLTLRTSVIGRELSSNHGLVEWLLSDRYRTVKGYANAIYSGFTTTALADIIIRIIAERKDLTGVYHVSSAPISKYDLLLLLNDRLGARVTIEKDEEIAIDRSLDSTRFREATGFQPPSWDSMIAGMAADPTPYSSFRVAPRPS